MYTCGDRGCDNRCTKSYSRPRDRWRDLRRHLRRPPRQAGGRRQQPARLVRRLFPRMQVDQARRQRRRTPPAPRRSRRAQGGRNNSRFQRQQQQRQRHSVAPALPTHPPTSAHRGRRCVRRAAGVGDAAAAVHTSASRALRGRVRPARQEAAGKERPKVGHANHPPPPQSPSATQQHAADDDAAAAGPGWRRQRIRCRSRPRRPTAATAASAAAGTAGKVSLAMHTKSDATREKEKETQPTPAGRVGAVNSRRGWSAGCARACTPTRRRRQRRRTPPAPRRSRRAQGAATTAGSNAKCK